ncbi:MAG TPA: hypothetical protein VF704_00950 [Allosphingosinicella sp.]|jgi:hypothetical protein
MSEPLMISGATVLIIAMLCGTLLRAWRGWLDVKRLEIAARPASDDGVGVRIELAAVKERLKRLEAIASGVEL